eukprot:s9167_g3.t1
MFWFRYVPTPPTTDRSIRPQTLDDLLDLQVKSPSTPGDAVGELSLFPAHRCVNAGEQEYDEACLLVGLGVPQQAEEVIYVDPCAVRAVLQ